MKKHNPGCGCCENCVECDTIFDLNWAAGLCLSYSNLGSPLSGGQDSANASYIAGLNSTFGNMTLAWTSTTRANGLATWSVKYAAAVDYTNYTIYSCDAGMSTVYSTTVAATLFNIGAWWSTEPGQPCHPRWFWSVRNWVTANGLQFRGNNLLHRRSTGMTPATGADLSPTGFPFSAVLMYPKSLTTEPWTSEISDTLALSASCENPTSTAMQAEFLTRYAPQDYTWPNGGGTSVIPILSSGNLHIANTVPPAVPTLSPC